MPPARASYALVKELRQVRGCCSHSSEIVALQRKNSASQKIEINNAPALIISIGGNVKKKGLLGG
jgi:hypothetical protein